jgi:hypothetical protein
MIMSTICPPAIQRTFLSNGLQHQNAFVKYNTLNIVVTIFKKLEHLVEQATAVKSAKFDAFARDIIESTKKRVPGEESCNFHQ